jgi:hypothetical protein
MFRGQDELAQEFGLIHSKVVMIVREAIAIVLP